ncbi:hypothetical protein Taro_024252 [Colocasia esculenta]|uniref:Uncharacterized protein n=1 Tax=Colocasia esculenta TaxID=4460 RepID=A0A843VD57_COLES|nr:hypothetical protein [Colocasia esculenta]
MDLDKYYVEKIEASKTRHKYNNDLGHTQWCTKKEDYTAGGADPTPLWCGSELEEGREASYSPSPERSRARGWLSTDSYSPDIRSSGRHAPVDSFGLAVDR